MIQLKVSSNGAIYPNRGINVGMKYDNTNEQILFVLPEALETYNKYVVYSNNKGTFLAPLSDNTWTIRSNITNYPGTVKCLFLLSETELDPNNFEINNVATFLKVSGEFQINVANHFLKPESVQPEEESPEIQLLFNNMMTLYHYFEEAKRNHYYRGVPGITPIKGIDYNTHEDGHFLLKDQGLGAHLEYKVDGVVFNNGIFPNKEAIIDAYNAMYAETEEEIGLYDHTYLAKNFGLSESPLETVVLENIAWYNTYTWLAGVYLGGTSDAIQIGSNANPIRYFEHQSVNSFTNVTKIQIKLSRAAVATDATYSIYIGDTPIAENVSIPETRTDFTVYTFDAISGPLTITFNHTQKGALYLGTVQIFATEIYEFDRAQWHWAQLQTENDANKYAVWVSTDENNEIQIIGVNEPTKTEALITSTEANILNAPLKSIKWPAMYLWTTLSSDSFRPQHFSHLLSNGLHLTYRAFHYSFDLSFSYTPGGSESNTIELHDPILGELIHTFQLVDGLNILHFEWEDLMGNTEAGSGGEFTFKMSVNGGVEQTLSSYVDSGDLPYTPKMLIFDISTDSRPSNPIVTNLILY